MKSRMFTSCKLFSTNTQDRTDIKTKFKIESCIGLTDAEYVCVPGIVLGDFMSKEQYDAQGCDKYIASMHLLSVRVLKERSLHGSK